MPMSRCCFLYLADLECLGFALFLHADSLTFVRFFLASSTTQLLCVVSCFLDHIKIFSSPR
jgi:hypothetical protein